MHDIRPFMSVLSGRSGLAELFSSQIETNRSGFMAPMWEMDWLAGSQSIGKRIEDEMLGDIFVFICLTKWGAM